MFSFLAELSSIHSVVLVFLKMFSIIICIISDKVFGLFKIYIGFLFFKPPQPFDSGDSKNKYTKNEWPVSIFLSKCFS